MKRLQGSTIEEALGKYNKMKQWRPFEYSGLKYVWNDGDCDVWYFYVSKPRSKTYGVLYTLDQ